MHRYPPAIISWCRFIHRLANKTKPAIPGETLAATAPQRQFSRFHPQTRSATATARSTRTPEAGTATPAKPGLKQYPLRHAVTGCK